MAVHVQKCCVETAKKAAEDYEWNPLDDISEAVANTAVCPECDQGVKVTYYQDEDTMEDS